jgi:benzoyl-CoA reductase/2-hydroxyglutaryl-CoA dehydratase subunit BcrC/BadD/HgdB
MRRALEIAGRKSGTPSIVIHVPKTRTPEAEDLYRSELAWLAAELERRTGRPLDPERLRQAVRVRNAIRRRIRDLRPGLSGADFASLIHLDGLLAADRMAAFLDGHRFVRSARAGLPVLVAGSPLPPGDLPWLDLLGSSGFAIVADATCTGDRAVDFGVDEASDPFEALVRAYHRNRRASSSGRTTSSTRTKLARARGAPSSGARSGDAISLRLEPQRAERRLGLSFLAVDVSCGEADSARLRTRVEAFAESLR